MIGADPARLNNLREIEKLLITLGMPSMIGALAWSAFLHFRSQSTTEST